MLGMAVGCSVGFMVGMAVGCSVGIMVGMAVGCSVGIMVGMALGCSVGAIVAGSNVPAGVVVVGSVVLATVDVVAALVVDVVVVVVVVSGAVVVSGSVVVSCAVGSTVGSSSQESKKDIANHWTCASKNWKKTIVEVLTLSFNKRCGIIANCDLYSQLSKNLNTLLFRFRS